MAASPIATGNGRQFPETRRGDARDWPVFGPGFSSMRSAPTTKSRRIIKVLLLVIVITGSNCVMDRIADRMANGLVYRSRQEFLGLPLVDIKFFNEAQLRELEGRGVIPGLKPLTARGWIAG